MSQVIEVTLNERPKRIVLVDAGQLFGIAAFNGQGIYALEPDPTDPDIPAVDPTYVFDLMRTYEFLKRHNMRMQQLIDLPVDDNAAMPRFKPECQWSCGPSQCGKTTFLEQAHARLHYPVRIIAGGRNIEAADLLAHQELVGGDTFTVHGDLLDAAKKGLSVIFNEADAIDPEQFIAFHDLFGEGRAIVPGTQDVVYARPGFAVYVAANTNGAGDATGLYRGTTEQNAAFLERFVVSEVNYLAEDAETRIVKLKVPDVPDDALATMIKFATSTRVAARGLSKTHRLRKPMSTGALLKWATEFVSDADAVGRGVIDASVHGSNWAFTHALDEAYSRKLDPASRQAAQDLLKTFIG